MDSHPSPSDTGPEMEEVVEMAKMLEGLADIIRMKDCGHATNHPNSFSMEKGKPWMLPYSQAIKESGNKIIVCPTGGFHDPDLNEEWIASGKADMVGMATPLIADPEFVKKCNEGRPEDIIACVSCHDCHNRSRTVGPHFTACTVNPKIGLITSKKIFIPAPLAPRKVAVIGGGPAGMKAAITAAERGHKVTLYEKGDALGGLLRHTDFTPYKWTYRDFKDYLITQVKKLGVNVQLKTTATPKMIKAIGYDTVLVATGAEPVIPKIPGADGKNVYDIVSVYRNKKSLGKNVVIIGGGLFSTETGCCLVLEGYKVTLLTSGKQITWSWALIQEEFLGSHNREIQMDIVLNNPNFSYVLDATATRISEGKVFYKDSTGSEKSVQADSVVIYAGLRPRMDEAIEFSGSAGQVLLLGDCTGQAGTVQKTIRSAFFVASQV
jgi:NADPH-dependent 2,4-dienoyl-CoA reductase/sulfur reductase-like enzyme